MSRVAALFRSFTTSAQPSFPCLVLVVSFRWGRHILNTGFNVTDATVGWRMWRLCRRSCRVTLSSPYSKSNSLAIPLNRFRFMCKIICLLTFALRRICYTQASCPLATLSFLFAWLFIRLANAHGPCIINQQNRGLDVICCCVAFNNYKIKMYQCSKIHSSKEE